VTKISVSRRYRSVLVVAANLALSAVSNYTAFLLRFDGALTSEYTLPLLKGLPILLAVRGATFWLFRLDRGLWRYIGLWDLENIFASVVLSSSAFAVAIIGIFDIRPYPRSIYFIDTLLLIGLLAGVRLTRRFCHEFDWFKIDKRVLIVGAGDAGEMIVRDMKHNRFYKCDPVGFVDDDAAKLGRSIHGVPVLGTRADIGRILRDEQPHEVLVAIPRAEPAEVRSIVKSLEPFKVPIKTLPNLRDIISGRVEVSQIRNLSLEDLMPRKSIGLDTEPVRRLINGRRVLITGAGGSIGSELSRQVASLRPSHLVLLDRYENALFDRCIDLDANYPGVHYDPVIGDIADEQRIERVFHHCQPELVFHAAAHKHVPLMEASPSEAIKNNVGGTRIVAEAASRHGVAEFVLISSDKAVNPSSVMGATKRIAEGIIRAVGRSSNTRFVAVRFGNVLGSNGSVTRVFAEQVARGGPVTVTHPDMRRFFMLIPEAVQLVLHAAAMRDSGAIFALDMGEPIKVLDLARNLIRLSGFVPDEEIAIKFTGMRPGEKLYEDLIEDGEIAEATELEKVLKVRPVTPCVDDLQVALPHLELAADRGSDTEVLAMLAALIPSFRPVAAPSSPAVEHTIASPTHSVVPVH
jgi:FlaA1/EpsC-like NDP-sugar epimerase